MGVIDSFVEGIAQDFAIDTAMDKWNEFAEEKIKTKDPYRDKSPEGKNKKLKLRDSATKEEQKMWKWVQKRAWVDDKCFMGCYPVDCGVGLGPIAVAIPVIGPFLMYAVHARLTTRAGMFFKLDAKTVAKLQANILFDLFLTFPPVIGSLFSWLNGCSTRNAAIIHTEVTKMLIQREKAALQNKAGSHDLQEVQTQTTYGDNPFSNNNRPGINGRATSSNSAKPPNQAPHNANPRGKENTANGMHTMNRPNNATSRSENPSLPPRDYSAPRPPNRVYQSQDSYQSKNSAYSQQRRMV